MLYADLKQAFRPKYSGIKKNKMQRFSLSSVHTSESAMGQTKISGGVKRGAGEMIQNGKYNVQCYTSER